MDELFITDVPKNLEATYLNNRKSIFNILIFKEMIKSIASLFIAKTKLGNMLECYEKACAEDAALEAAIAVTQKIYK